MTATLPIRVELTNETRDLRVEPAELDQSIADVLYSHDIRLNTRCGRLGLCDGCEVELFRGSVIDLDAGRQVNAGSDAILLKACRHQFEHNNEVSIRVPSQSLAMHSPVASEDFSIRIPFSHDPLFTGRLAAAIDVGTTMVTVAVFDLSDGAIIASRSAPNGQSRWGQDVLSRISSCQRDPQVVTALQYAVCARTIDPLLQQCLMECGAVSSDLAGATVAGNTVMLHLLAGEDPTSLGYAPFEPVFTGRRVLSAGMIGLSGRACAEHTPIHLLPSASAYVGADVIGGAIATGLAYRPGPEILLDLGTNGEIILNRDKQKLACSTAAGPAFEGMGLSSGMVASRGAISRVRLVAETATVELEVIGDELPRGICGSAYIDLLAEGRRLGLIDCLGRFRFDHACEFNSRKTCMDGEIALQIATGVDEKPIVLTEGDIAVLLQAKAAIAAGTLILLEKCGIMASEVQSAFVAGAFGTHLHAAHAVDMGLLPTPLRGRIEAVGNASLAGAYLAAVDRRLLDDMELFANDVEIVDLNFREHFEECFINSLGLP